VAVGPGPSRADRLHRETQVAHCLLGLGQFGGRHLVEILAADHFAPRPCQDRLPLDLIACRGVPALRAARQGLLRAALPASGFARSSFRSSCGDSICIRLDRKSGSRQNIAKTW
jgi:hypothetical protein